MTAAEKRALGTCLEDRNCPVHRIDEVPDTERAQPSVRVDYAQAVGGLEACVAQVQAKASLFALNGKFQRPGREESALTRERVQRASAALTALEVAIERARQHLSVISNNAEFVGKR